MFFVLALLLKFSFPSRFLFNVRNFQEEGNLFILELYIFPGSL